MRRKSLLAVAVLLVAASTGTAAFIDTFESDTVGSPPANWPSTGTNGTTRTANVGTDSPNQYLARRDLASGGSIVTNRSLGAGDTKGFVGFDIRFNQGIDAEFNVKLFARSTSPANPSVFEPITLQWFPSAYNPTLPHIFRTRGNNTYPTITSNFPIGSWQTIGVFFSANPGPGGTYSVHWNGIETTAAFLNQGPGGLVIDRIQILLQGTDGSTESVDIDNVIFFPEPGSVLAAVGLAAAGLTRRRSVYARARR